MRDQPQQVQRIGAVGILAQHLPIQLLRPRKIAGAMKRGRLLQDLIYGLAHLRWIIAWRPGSIHCRRKRRSDEGEVKGGKAPERVSRLPNLKFVLARSFLLRCRGGGERDGNGFVSQGRVRGRGNGICKLWRDGVL